MRKRTVLSVLLCLCLLAFSAHRTQAQTPTGSLTLLTFYVLENGTPLAGVVLELTLLRYGQTLEEIPAGSCTTDQAGACQIEVSDMPRMADGYGRAKLTVGNYGTHTIGWYGDQVETTILVSDLALQATVNVPIEEPYEMPSATAAVMEPSITPIPPAASPTPLPLTATELPEATHTPIPASPSPTELPASGTLRPTIGPLVLICGGVLMATVGVLIWRSVRQHPERNEWR